MKLFIIPYNIVFRSKVTVAPPLFAFVITRSLRFTKYSIAFLSVCVKLFLGNLFLSENLCTTFLLTASMNFSTVGWFFLGFQLVLPLMLSSSFASSVYWFCSSLLWNNTFNLTCYWNFLEPFLIYFYYSVQM